MGHVLAELVDLPGTRLAHGILEVNILCHFDLDINYSITKRTNTVSSPSAGSTMLARKMNRKKCHKEF
jgi:hypothetical protein